MGLGARMIQSSAGVEFAAIGVKGDVVELSRRVGAQPARTKLHSRWELCVGGTSGEWWYRGAIQSWNGGPCVACFEPDELHYDITVPRGDECVLETSVPPALARRLGIDPALIAVANDAPTWSALRELHATVWTGDGDAGAQERACLRALEAAARAVPRDEARRREPPALRRVREYLDRNHVRDIPLDELCDVAKISKFHLCRSFRERYGVPPHAYQTQVRLEKARELLRAGFSSTHVAFEVGFADQPHFTRHFRRAVGVTPGVYARQVTRATVQPNYDAHRRNGVQGWLRSAPYDPRGHERIGTDCDRAAGAGS